MGFTGITVGVPRQSHPVGTFKSFHLFYLRMCEHPSFVAWSAMCDSLSALPVADSKVWNIYGVFAVSKCFTKNGTLFCNAWRDRP